MMGRYNSVEETNIDQMIKDLDRRITALEVGISLPWTAYTPVWSSTGTQPAIGDGTIVGAFTQSGLTVTVRGAISMGLTTTFGTGSWRVSIPVDASSGAVNGAGALFLFDNGTATNVGICSFVDTTKLWLVSPSGDITNVSPFTWAATDVLRWTITYEAA